MAAVSLADKITRKNAKILSYVAMKWSQEYTLKNRKTGWTPMKATKWINMPCWYFTVAYDFHQSADTYREEEEEGSSRFGLAAQTHAQARTQQRQHSPTQPSWSMQGWRGKANTVKLFCELFNVDFLKLKVFMNETPLFKTRPPPSQSRTTWRKEWGKAEWLRAF